MWTYDDLGIPVKLGLVVIACFLALRFSPAKVPLVNRIKRGWQRLAARPWQCGLVLVAVSLGLNVLFTIVQYPQPVTHDEFSYLLASDTFASGRLANPAHPLWEHFETYHVLSRPSWVSKYPPASGMVMALGQALTGHPIVGVWLAFALATLAMYWMLRAWTAPQWAALGALLIAANGPLIRAWGQTYWGGSMALLGGALVFGGLRRIWSAEEQPLLRDAVLLGLGLVVMANSRPMEGLLVSVPVFVLLLVWLVKTTQLSWTYKCTRVAAPIILIGLAGLAGMAHYNRAITGDALTMPYKLHDDTYSMSSLLISQTPPAAPSYNHPRMERFYREWGRERQLSYREPAVYRRQLTRKLELLWNFLPIGIGLSLIPVVFLWRDPWSRLAIGIFAALLLVHSQLAAYWIYPHYIAPGLALFMVINLQCLRHLRIWNRDRKWGLLATRVILIVAFLELVPTWVAWQTRPMPNPRADVMERLADDPIDRHLVVCTYGPDYPVYSDWVYNAANIDASPVVWARDLSESKNAKLFEYFADRKIWRCHLENDETMTLQPIHGCQGF